MCVLCRGLLGFLGLSLGIALKPRADVKELIKFHVCIHMHSGQKKSSLLNAYNGHGIGGKTQWGLRALLELV